MPGALVDDSVVLSDPKEASQIYNKGYYGYPQSGGGLELDLLEAAYLMESGRLEVATDGEPVPISSIIARGSASQSDFEIKYIVYRDLRSRGYVVKADGGEFDFRVFPRGGTPTSSETRYWIRALSERSLFSIAAFFEEIEKAEQKRKELLIAIVDEEGDITYYKASRSAPKGRPEGEWRADPVEAFLLEDRVMVFDELGADRLYRIGFYGKKLGKALQLSLIETAFLMEEGRLTVKGIASERRVGLERFKKRAERFQPDFDLRLRAYRDLRSRGLVVKTGFKYGSHFRVYEDDPERIHAKYLVHAVPENYETIWPEVSRAVRLAHGVKKDILFGRILSDGAEYVKLKRVRP